MKKTDPLIIVEQQYNSSITEVWNAITNPNEMRKWFFEQIDSFKPAVGFETEFLVKVETRNFTHLWKIKEIIEFHRIKYQWRYKEYSGDSFVTFELMEEKGKVNLKLIAEVIEDFPDDVPEFKRESCIGGWNYFIKESLNNYLNNKAKQ